MASHIPDLRLHIFPLGNIRHLLDAGLADARKMLL